MPLQAIQVGFPELFRLLGAEQARGSPEEQAKMNSATPRWKTTVPLGPWPSSNSQENGWENTKVSLNSPPVDRTASQIFTSKAGGQGRCSSSLQLAGKRAVPPCCGSEWLTQTSECCLHQSMFEEIIPLLLLTGVFFGLPFFTWQPSARPEEGIKHLTCLCALEKSSSLLPALTILRYLGFSSSSPAARPLLSLILLFTKALKHQEPLWRHHILVTQLSSWWSPSWSLSFARLQKAAKTPRRCMQVGLGNSTNLHRSALVGGSYSVFAKLKPKAALFSTYLCLSSTIQSSWHPELSHTQVVPRANRKV